MQRTSATTCTRTRTAGGKRATTGGTLLLETTRFVFGCPSPDALCCQLTQTIRAPSLTAKHIESLNVSTSHITPGLVGERLVKTLRLLPLADLDEVHDGDFWQDAHPYRLPSDLIECMDRAGMNWDDVHYHAEDGELHPDFPPFELLDEEYESYDDDDEEGDDDDDEEGDDDDDE